MPKIKVLSRNIDEYIRESKHDIQKIHRDYTPESHPFEEAREYVKALNATKLERSFAKPFLYDLTGNSDAVNILTNHRSRLTTVYSGAFDGVVKEWNIASKSPNFTLRAHSGKINGLVATSERLISIGDDCFIKHWDNDPLTDKSDEKYVPVQTISTKATPRCVDAQWNVASPFYATGDISSTVNVYNPETSDPIRSYTWGNDSLTSIKFNPTEPQLLATSSQDRSITLYDIRSSKPIRKVTLAMNSNMLTWNPQNPLEFALANEDKNAYIFDTRKLSHASKILKGHIAAVMSICYSPTGRQLVTGSYDKTLRIFNTHGNNSSNSVDVYHTKRMQKVWAVTWSGDNRYILSASDEFNVRVWKAKAWDRLGYLSANQKKNRDYQEALKKKYASFPEIRKISKHRHLSKHLFVKSKEEREMSGRVRRKEKNRRANNRDHKTVPARQKVIVKEHM